MLDVLVFFESRKDLARFYVGLRERFSLGKPFYSKNLSIASRTLFSMLHYVERLDRQVQLRVYSSVTSLLLSKMI